ncbi:hypothetical protein ACFP2T_07515 [Plantactinospora solaniradicis]|uniref:Uncharacterized protein n=1 Tax=Plantactinospora solaniradicis TaxID=1723736 RepID=A0ABW1K524_9ACTN
MTRPSADEMGVLRKIQADLGGLVEVMVVGTTASDWMSAMTALSDSGFDVHVFDTDTSSPIPMEPAVFTWGEDSPYAMRIRAGDQVWTASLYDPNVISLQCEADEFRTIQDVQEVKRLMSVLSAAVGKDSILAPESAYPGQLRPYLHVHR